MRYFYTAIFVSWLSLREVVARTRPLQSGATDAMQSRAALSAPLLRRGPLQSIFECLNGLPKTRPSEWKFRTENSLARTSIPIHLGICGVKPDSSGKVGPKTSTGRWKRCEAGESPDSWPLMSSIITHIITITQPHL